MAFDGETENYRRSGECADRDIVGNLQSKIISDVAKLRYSLIEEHLSETNFRLQKVMKGDEQLTFNLITIQRSSKVKKDALSQQLPPGLFCHL